MKLPGRDMKVQIQILRNLKFNLSPAVALLGVAAASFLFSIYLQVWKVGGRKWKTHKSAQRIMIFFVCEWISDYSTVLYCL